MLSIRLSQVGKKNKKSFRITVAENTKDTFGRAMEILGHYNPHNKEFKIDVEKTKDLLAKGAQPTNTVHNLLLKHGVIKGKTAKSVSISKKIQEKLDKKKTEKQKAEEEKLAAAKAAEEAAKQAIEEKNESTEVPVVDAIEEPAKTENIAEESSKPENTTEKAN